MKGYKRASSPTHAQVALNHILPFLAYHKIYDDWYRNANIQKPVFVRHNSYDDKTALSGCPYIATTLTAGNISTGGVPDSDLDIDVTDANTPLSSIGFANFSTAPRGVMHAQPVFSDGKSLFSLRQRNWSKDYFTTATLYPQQSGTTAGASISATTPAEGDSTQFTISQIRQANILQKWLERNNIAGSRYADQIRATFGVLPSDAMLDRAIFLGGMQEMEEYY